MVAADTRSVLIFGKTETGDYDLVHSDAAVPEQILRLFVSFAKAVNWRPRKLDAPEYVATGVLPCGEHVIVFRLLEDSKDADPQKRPLVMRVEGVVCPASDIRWKQWLNPVAWPPARLAVPFNPLNAEPQDGVSVPVINQALVYGKPFLPEPRSDLLTYPTHCLLQPPAPAGVLASGAPRVREATRAATTPQPSYSSQPNQRMKLTFAAVLALIMGLAVGAVITEVRTSPQMSAMKADNTKLREEKAFQATQIQTLVAERDADRSKFESEVEKTRAAIKPVEVTLSKISKVLSDLDQKADSLLKGQNSAGQRSGGSGNDVKPKANNPDPSL